MILLFTVAQDVYFFVEPSIQNFEIYMCISTRIEIPMCLTIINQPTLFKIKTNIMKNHDVIQKLTHREQILKRPDSVIGSVESTEQEWFLLNEGSGKMEKRVVYFPEGLLQIFDEILVNAADNKQRDPKGTTKADITVYSESGKMTIFNDGQVLPVRLHSEHQVLIPELAFGSLLTSENYDDTQQRTTGGRNGMRY